MGLFDKLNKPAPAAPAADPNHIINLKKEAGISLKKAGLSDGTKAAVYLVLDYSGSMRPFYKNHTVQDFTEKVLAVSAQLDDDGTVPVTLFDRTARAPFEVTVNNYQGIIDREIAKAGSMGTTNYAAAMRSVIAQHKASGATEPALVIFQTDGSPDSRTEAQQVLCEAASLPIFWQFVGFGHDDFAFLKKLDDLAVPRYRVIDNADFFPAGADPKSLGVSSFYDQLLGEFPGWLKQAKAQGIVR